MGSDRLVAPPALVFTDLDGTLLDFDTYSPAGAEEALARLKARHVPLVFCSSKTEAEQRVYLERLGLRMPFIVENGSAVFVPRGLLPDVLFDAGWIESGDARVRVLGLPAATIRAHLRTIRRALDLSFRGFGEMTVQEVTRLTGLPPDAAQRARQRDYSETLHADLSSEAWSRFTRALSDRNLQVAAGGRFFTVTSAATDKGRAVRLLTDLYRRAYGHVPVLGLGDSPNDAPLLAAVDEPYLVQRPDGSWAPLDVPGLRRVPGVGPAGWNAALVERLNAP